MSIVLFDGKCFLCNGIVRFIIHRDPQAIFSFAPLESEAGKRLLDAYKVPKRKNSLILIEENRFWSESTAALKICKHLKGGWKFLYFFILIPKPLRDLVYRAIANNRYRLFKKKACPIPSKEMRKRSIK